MFFYSCFKEEVALKRMILRGFHHETGMKHDKICHLENISYVFNTIAGP